jgi:hypothetical protein
LGKRPAGWAGERHGVCPQSRALRLLCRVSRRVLTMQQKGRRQAERPFSDILVSGLTDQVGGLEVEETRWGLGPLCERVRDSNPQTLEVSHG